LNIQDKYVLCFDNTYPLLLDIENKCNIDIIKLIKEYSEENSILLNIKEKVEVVSFKNNNNEIIKLLIKYGNKYHQTLSINNMVLVQKYYYPIFYGINFNNIGLVQLLMNCVNEHGLHLDIDHEEESTLFAIENNNN